MSKREIAIGVLGCVLFVAVGYGAFKLSKHINKVVCERNERNDPELQAAKSLNDIFAEQNKILMGYTRLLAELNKTIAAALDRAYPTNPPVMVYEYLLSHTNFILMDE